MPGEGGEKGGSGIWEALRLVKGIGAKRMDSIIEALSLALEEKGKAGEMA